jgi:hypothetical protein
MMGSPTHNEAGGAQPVFRSLTGGTTMTDAEDQRPDSTEEAAEIVEHDPALQTASDASDDDAVGAEEEVAEPTD